MDFFEPDCLSALQRNEPQSLPSGSSRTLSPSPVSARNMRNCGVFRRFSEESRRVSLQLRLAGGGCSHERTLLCPKFPANREKYREFREFGGPDRAVNSCNRFILDNLWSRELVLVLHPNRELSGAYQGIQSRLSGN